jgi:prevent-host-death family protein
MITANMHEAKSRLSEFVKAVEERGEVVILHRNGKPVAEIRAIVPRPVNRRLIKPDPSLRVKLAPGYDPAEPLSDEEWPEDCR